MKILGGIRSAWRRSPFSLSEDRSEEQARRNRLLITGVLSGVAVKGVALLFTLITVPMTLHYLGPVRYGVWVTMISILSWLSMVDLGLANGLTTLLSLARAEDHIEQARNYVSAAFWGLVSIAVLLGLIALLLMSRLNWGVIFNLGHARLVGEVSDAMAIAIAIFLLNLPLAVTQRIYLACQRGSTANCWQLVSSFAGVVGIYLVTKLQGNLVALVIGYSGAQLFVGIMNICWLFWRVEPGLRPSVAPSLIDARAVLKIGGLFFFNQIATMVVFQKDNVLITHYLGPASGAKFSIVWQMFLYLNVVNMLIAPYLGPAFGEAYAKNDVAWMRVVARRYLICTMAFALLAVSFISLFYQEILRFWVGRDIVPRFTLIAWLSALTMILSVQWPINSLLNGAGKLRKFTKAYTAAAFLNVFLSIYLIRRVGIDGGVISTVLTLLLVSLLPSISEFFSVLKGRSVCAATDFDVLAKRAV
jgi:O-antigen/teichoic acid export membrane protein